MLARKPLYLAKEEMAGSRSVELWEEMAEPWSQLDAEREVAWRVGSWEQVLMASKE